MTETEALALAEAANALHFEWIGANDFFPGVEIADAIESAWAGHDPAEYVLEEATLANCVLVVLSDDLVNDVAALAPLRQALRDVTELRPPLFVKPDEPLFIFGSTEKALAIEWQDLEDGGYQGYDADGRVFRLGARTWKEKFLRLVPYETGETTLRLLDSPKRPSELRELLIDALATVKAEERSVLEYRSLNDLKAAALERFGLN